MPRAQTRLPSDSADSRVVGSFGDPSAGPTVVAFGALHGNEPAGLSAIDRVLTIMRSGALDVRGRFVGIMGNRAALAAGRRFVGRDLNRGWTAESCARSAVARADQTPEDAEQREILAALRTVAAAASGPLVVLDLHSTSGPASPFSVAPDLLRNRPLAVNLPVPTVLGLEEIIDGTLLGYLCEQGHLGLAIEGGQHDAPQTAELLEACVWFSLATAGIVEGTSVPGREEKLWRLRAAGVGKPTLVEIKHRHGVAPDDAFVMEPGYSNFISVDKGEVVAHDRRGPIAVPRAGLMMLPRYQDEGDDGFFIAQPITPAWLRISKAAREARLEYLLRWAPGIRRDNRDQLTLLGGAPSEWLLGLLHLLGYRGLRPTAEGLEFFRRRRG
ncbi:MAG: succinylglutamate desuccinylase/aspartoacylase family protein [Myxococcota bacterium]